MFKPAEDPFEDPVEVPKKSIWGHMTEDDKFKEMYCYGEEDKTYKFLVIQKTDDS